MGELRFTPSAVPPARRQLMSRPLGSCTGPPSNSVALIATRSDSTPKCAVANPTGVVLMLDLIFLFDLVAVKANCPDSLAADDVWDLWLFF